MLARTLGLFGTCSYTPCHQGVFIPPSNNPLCSRQRQQLSAPLVILLGSSFKLYKASRSSFVRLSNLLERVSMSSNVSMSFFQAAKICLYDDVLVPWIKGRLRPKSVNYKRSLIISKVPHKLSLRKKP